METNSVGGDGDGGCDDDGGAVKSNLSTLSQTSIPFFLVTEPTTEQIGIAVIENYTTYRPGRVERTNPSLNIRHEETQGF